MGIAIDEKTIHQSDNYFKIHPDDRPIGERQLGMFDDTLRIGSYLVLKKHTSDSFNTVINELDKIQIEKRNDKYIYKYMLTAQQKGNA